MPELPEVETVRRAGAGDGEGAASPPRISVVPICVAAAARSGPRLTGRRVGMLARRGKFLLLLLDGGETMLMHLGVRALSGRPALIGKHDQWC